MTQSWIRLGQEPGAEREWLETNGLGGYASGTETGIATRRYHGLLVAALAPPAERFVLLSKFEETLIVDGVRFAFSANQYPGVVHPDGVQYLAGFRLDPFPTFVYRMGGVELEKRIFLVHGEDTAVVEYEVRCPKGPGAVRCELELRPLLAYRDYHSTAHANGAIDGGFETVDGATVVRPYPGLPALYLAHPEGTVEGSGHWYHDFEYAAERERGLDYREDLFNPFVVRFALPADGGAAVIASTQPRRCEDAPRLREREQSRRAALAEIAGSESRLVQRLAVAADAFVVQRGEGKTIIAGYPWFSDWGRDTMIALPGLTLATGRFEVARDVLATFARSIDRGMLPNRFPDQGETPEYNTVDATLWYFEAVRAYLAYTDDYAFVQAQIYPRLREILDWHLRGTRYGIHVDSDCLLACGEPEVQLTWMDAKVGDWVVTPRTGKPVEIQALWFNALSVMEELAAAFDDRDMQILAADAAATAKASFRAQFWNEEAGCLYDVVADGGPDGSIRPNQIFAVSLHHSMLDAERARQVVDVVRRELLTPLGLRTLSAEDPRYRARYEGGVWERDSAYHQGTVWPWLLGPFITAFVRTRGRSECARHQAQLWLKGIEDHLHEACVGQISEIADAEFPHRPRGCVAQAWSVGELLRTAVEDVYEVRLPGSLAA
jgi:predicted glycogen debranching enzyme